MKTVIDQIPRLLAAMYYIAVQDLTIGGNFDLICQFSKVKQVLNSRKSLCTDPLFQVKGFTEDIISLLNQRSKAKKIATPILWSLRSKSKEDSEKLLKNLLRGRKIQTDKMIRSIFALPFYKIEKLNIYSEIAKSTGRRIGKLQLTLDIDAGQSRNNGEPLNLVLVLGTSGSRRLLTRWEGRIHSGQKEIKLEFDWDMANESGSEDEGIVILRSFFEEYRGLDCEILCPLHS